MKHYIKNYLNAFLHPIILQEKLKEEWERDELVLTKEFELLPMAVISWICALINSIFYLLLIYIAVVYFKNHEEVFGRLPLIGKTLESGSVFPLVIQMIFFPLIFLGYGFIIKKITLFFIDMYSLPINSYQNKDRVAEAMVSLAMSTHLLFLIPLFGAVLQPFAFVLYFFIGLQKNLEMSAIQSIVVLLSPLFLLGLLLLFFAMFVVLLFNDGILRMIG